MMLYKKIFFLLLAFTLFSGLYCQQDQSKSNSSLLGLSGSSAESIDSGHYIEPTGDDSCDGCPSQLSSADAEKLNADLASNNILNAKIDLNVRVTIPKSGNPHSDGDVNLWATVIRPEGNEKLPTILMASPYMRASMMALYLPLVGSRYNLMAI